MKFLAAILFSSISILIINCQNSITDFSSLKMVDNKELKSTLFNINNSFLHKDKLERFFIKGYKISSMEEIEFNDGDDKMEFYYFAVSSLDENPEIDGKLYITDRYNYPKIEKIIDNNKDNCFDVIINHKVKIRERVESQNLTIKLPYF
ncbi:hypothetical protein J4050_14315 [Winogradskyella sp. DF17]|uniref:Lipoprotein n=1 Tax=Winogradskyella pelagia TaxID=2819984 RepID=A0ABS3T5C7_9FLAO|nr:hypothetical protein [Winogradskyella sp. DF17]MBO3117927.1 hypothetical protein [Winogradskyella sp. DF17]